MKFRSEVPGKWILSGEHAVLRGSPALVFPLLSRTLRLEYETEDTTSFRAEFAGEHGFDLKLLFWGVLDHALQTLGLGPASQGGAFRLTNAIPLGAGLGASAALCVAVSQWCHQHGHIGEDDIPEFARQLENLFHGESSGVDIAVVCAKRPLRFMRGQGGTPLSMTWKPKLYLSFCGQRGMTSECVAKVKSMNETDAVNFSRLDERMKASAERSEKSLLMSAEDGLHELASALNMARDCFQDWGLCEGALGRHMTLVQELGARAVKPTGSGGGGYVLSLWDNDPPSTSAIHFVAAI